MSEQRLIHLVDDDDAVRHSASFMLRHAGFAVKTYTDGVAFLDVVEDAAAGCILLDVQMPRMDGLEVQEQLNARGIAMPVIVLTVRSISSKNPMKNRPLWTLLVALSSVLTSGLKETFWSMRRGARLSI